MRHIATLCCLLSVSACAEAPTTTGNTSLSQYKVCNGRFESIVRNYYDFNGGWGAIRIEPVGSAEVRLWAVRFSRSAYDNYKTLKSDEYVGIRGSNFGFGNVVPLERNGSSYSFKSVGGNVTIRLSPTKPHRYSIVGIYNGGGEVRGELECEAAGPS